MSASREDDQRTVEDEAEDEWEMILGRAGSVASGKLLPVVGKVCATPGEGVVACLMCARILCAMMDDKDGAAAVEARHAWRRYVGLVNTVEVTLIRVAVPKEEGDKPS